MSFLSGITRAPRTAVCRLLSKSSPLRPVIRLATYFCLWCLLVTWLVDSGMLWRAVGPRLSGLGQYAAQDALLNGRHRPNRDVLVVGDRLFLDRVRGELPADASVLEVPLRTVDLYDVVKALRMTQLRLDGRAPAYRFRTLVVQMSPHYFSNVMWRGPWDNYKYLESMAEKKAWPMLPNRSTGLFFDLLKAWATAGEKDPHALPDRPPSPGPAFGHEPAPPHLRAFVGALKMLNTPTVLVPDFRGTRYAGAPDIKARFRSEAMPALAAHPDLESLALWSGFAGLQRMLPRQIDIGREMQLSRRAQLPRVN